MVCSLATLGLSYVDCTKAGGRLSRQTRLGTRLASTRGGKPGSTRTNESIKRLEEGRRKLSVTPWKEQRMTVLDEVLSS